MSGGFFRGTSAAQDTRFSNKEAKLLKSQKFAPELEHLVDIMNVKMDVIKPWIARRVTELIGFEDEVLINFIYGLLEGKEINGKEIQIQLTGFMEKNTGKFMKELWALLLSAQKNASGVPQQFLDAKEEETRNKKAETDRILSEIQLRKEKETNEYENEKARKMDGGLDSNITEGLNRRAERGSDIHSGDENGAGVTNGFRRRKRSSRSPYSSDRLPSPHRGARSRSISKSYSNSRSYSKERSISRSLSGSASPRARRRSVSPERMLRSPQRRSDAPRRHSARESISPRGRSHFGRRSSSRTRHRSPSPLRRRVNSPAHQRSLSSLRRRSPSPARRRSPSPRCRSRSPTRPRSPSPQRRRSPLPRWRRSRSPWRRPPSPRRHRSPSPVQRRRQRWSLYTMRRRSPSTDRWSLSPRGHRSRSPVRRSSSSPVRRKSPVQARRRSPTTSPSRRRSSASGSSASPIRRSSVSPATMKSPRLQKSPRGSVKERTRNQEPARMEHRQPISLSPQRDHADRNHSRRKVPTVTSTPVKSPNYLVSPRTRTGSFGEDRRLASSGKGAGGQRTLSGSQSPPDNPKDHKGHHGSPVRNDEGLQNSREDKENNYTSTEKGSVRSSGGKNMESSDRPFSGSDLRHKDNEMRSDEVLVKEARAPKKSPSKSSLPDERPDIPYSGNGSKSNEKRSSRSKDKSRSESLVDSHKKVEQRSPNVHSESGSEGSDKLRAGAAEKRKHRGLSRREALSDDTSSDSEVEDKKEAKRRRKEEKKIRKKEQRRQRREERHRRREEKSARKQNRKSKDANVSDGEHGSRKYSNEHEETDSHKKRLEIQLRERALESLRTKKGITR